ncbi:hypothetical protein AWW66_19545 [Micromonospora rosaria]|uniref:DUF4429 domain-containing protein n=1 Tax=Micromonospora rosaria TaxID=47874 RepID=A0A136PPC2_9ACTN|nr:hypothetical protein [Micromonospora rosaria]KXK60315.1 hypothetical protein AWW66_19545 [Micromonospora rosaria]
MGVDREPLTFDYENLHVRVDRGVFELFTLDGSPAEHTFRVPLRWLGVSLHYKKPDKPGTLSFGIVRDPRSALYNTDRLAFRYSTSPGCRVPPGDEALFRAYLTEVARLAGRPVA